MNKSEPQSMAGIGTHDRAIEIVKEMFPPRCRVADLAAGEGAFSELLHREGFDVVAIDFANENWKSSIPLRVQDLDSEFAAPLLENEEKFDGIVAIEIIEHLENPFRFVRECSKLLRPGGLLMLTTPNVESVFSRLVFLYTGRLYSFNEYETVRPAHITPIFRWKLQMMLDEAGFEVVREAFVPLIHAPEANFKVRATARIAKTIEPLFKGSKGAEGRIVVARHK